MKQPLAIYVDGACSGNPGPGAIGVVIKTGDNVIKELSKPIGLCTNNIAEYTALIYALQEALRLGAQKVIVHSDSELLCRQLSGDYKVQHPNIKALFEQVQHLRKGFVHFQMRQIPREQNGDADGLARKAIKKGQAKVVASPLTTEGRKVRAPKDCASC